LSFDRRRILRACRRAIDRLFRALARRSGSSELGVEDMGSSLLTDRGVIELVGHEAEAFLHRIVTNSTLAIEPGEARYAGLLTPQGKLLFDFFVVPLPLPLPGGDGFYLDCVKTQAQDLAKKLAFLKLRAKITVTDRSADLAVAASWNEAVPQGFSGLVYRDPRAAALGLRAIGPQTDLAARFGAHEDAYETHRIGLGIAKGGLDFAYGDAFVHDANLDLTHGVDFDKGCYVGQEVVARVHHRRSVRKRIVKIRFDGAPPAVGTQIMAGETPIGQIGSIAGDQGLAMLRLDRLEEARAAGVPLTAGTRAVDVDVPSDLLVAAQGAR
jgi:tRNA-modifying protein YgfZ